MGAAQESVAAGLRRRAGKTRNRRPDGAGKPATPPIKPDKPDKPTKPDHRDKPSKPVHPDTGAHSGKPTVGDQLTRNSGLMEQLKGLFPAGTRR